VEVVEVEVAGGAFAVERDALRGASRRRPSFTVAAAGAWWNGRRGAGTCDCNVGPQLGQRP
jgi:hypothetical protein